MELHRLGVKLFAVDSAAIRVKDFVPVFHSWIQKQCVDGHLLIDVHDYSHINNGPGILLVAHEGNFSTDLAEGRLGIAYYRKQPAGEGLEANLRAAVKTVFQAADLLEQEAVFKGALKFRRDEAVIVANDRLLAPNDAATFEALKPALSRVVGAGAALVHESSNPKDRLTIRVQGLSPQ